MAQPSSSPKKMPSPKDTNQGRGGGGWDLKKLKSIDSLSEIRLYLFEMKTMKFKWSIFAISLWTIWSFLDHSISCFSIGVITYHLGTRFPSVFNSHIWNLLAQFVMFSFDTYLNFFKNLIPGRFAWFTSFFIRKKFTHNACFIIENITLHEEFLENVNLLYMIEMFLSNKGW